VGHFHGTKAARSERLDCLMLAEGGNFYAVSTADLEEILSFFAFQGATVNDYLHYE